MTFDVVIVGLGHAGAEAALASARMGLSTAAITLSLERAAVMSCNPAIGGTAKGHLVRELDALGGQMAASADAAGTHFVTLNRSKGPAVQATRVLCDRNAYSAHVQSVLATQSGLTLIQGEVATIEVEDGIARGVRLVDGRSIQAKAVVVTTGTFLQAILHRGPVQDVGGRLGDAAASALSASLRALGLELGRFKTGTPARLRASSIDWSRCERQPSETPRPFSSRTPRTPFPLNPLLDCFVTHPTEATHRLVRENPHRSTLSGRIEGRGRRNGPSLFLSCVLDVEVSGEASCWAAWGCTGQRLPRRAHLKPPRRRSPGSRRASCDAWPRVGRCPSVGASRSAGCSR